MICRQIPSLDLGDGRVNGRQRELFSRRLLYDLDAALGEELRDGLFLSKLEFVRFEFLKRLVVCCMDVLQR
jgi:hypothetical protein